VAIWTVPATVLRLVDADTPILLLDLGWYVSYGPARVRVAHINAPELPTPEGIAARSFAAAMLPVGLKVTFASHSLDKYGRPLGAITLPDGQDFGQAMLDSGHAVPMKG
jgi:endonuclease YncB( thermonuclease family)